MDKAEIVQLEFNQKDVRKAQSYAGWSYIGLVIPLVGWILAGLSLSLLKDLPKDGELARRAKRVRETADISIVLSTIINIFLQ